MNKQCPFCKGVGVVEDDRHIAHMAETIQREVDELLEKPFDIIRSAVISQRVRLLQLATEKLTRE